ncbi:MAG: hypothetical protein QME66_10875 [Candidatus Eisenbacteria bacterium]|nr:hypothetical protein [Candidatus Eisenbacteria bacterium]
MVKISERSFEETIECALLAHGPNACVGDPTKVFEQPLPFGEAVPGGYHKRSPEEYDRKLCLIPGDVLDFVYATQPKEWTRLKGIYGPEVKENFLRRVAWEVEKRG